jgi:hypothetical protein
MAFLSPEGYFFAAVKRKFGGGENFFCRPCFFILPTAKM